MFSERINQLIKTGKVKVYTLFEWKYRKVPFVFKKKRKAKHIKK